MQRFGPVWMWLLALLPLFVVAIYQWPYGCGLACGDYAQYYLHADAILDGRPYGDIGYIYTLKNVWIGPPSQPPGLPLTLVPIFALVGPSALAIKLLTVLSAAAFLVLIGIRLRKSEQLEVTLAVVLVSAAALAAMDATTTARSDLGFAALVWALILVADREGRWTAGRVVVVTLLGLGALAYRTAGAALIPAMILFALMRREGWRPVMPAIIWTALGVIAAIKLSVATPTISNLLLSPSGVLATVKIGLYEYRFGFLESTLYPFPWKTANAIYHVIVLPIMGVGLLRCVWRERRTALGAFFVAYMGMLLVIPVRDTRYIWTVLPVIALGLVDGLRLIASLVPRLSPHAARLAAGTCAALALAATLTKLSAPPPKTLLAYPEIRSLFAHIKAMSSTAEPRVAFSNPHVLTWETGADAMGTFVAPPAEAMAEFRRQRITHLVVGEIGIAPTADSAMRVVVTDSVDSFTPVYRDSLFTLYQLKPQ